MNEHLLHFLWVIAGIITIVIVLIIIVIIFFKYLVKRTEKGMAEIDAIIMARVGPVLIAIDSNPQMAQITANACCRDVASRFKLYERLQDLGKMEYFPEEHNNHESLAESDLVNWLMHPNELKNAPDEIEAVTNIEDEDGIYFLFRYRTHEPHWAADRGWLSGLAGPYAPDRKRIFRGTCTFSNMTPIDSVSADEHIEALKNRQ